MNREDRINNIYNIIKSSELNIKMYIFGEVHFENNDVNRIRKEIEKNKAVYYIT